jgi:hypothetical protein
MFGHSLWWYCFGIMLSLQWELWWSLTLSDTTLLRYWPSRASAKRQKMSHFFRWKTDLGTLGKVNLFTCGNPREVPGKGTKAMKPSYAWVWTLLRHSCCYTDSRHHQLQHIYFTCHWMCLHRPVLHQSLLCPLWGHSMPDASAQYGWLNVRCQAIPT